MISCRWLIPELLFLNGSFLPYFGLMMATALAAMSTRRLTARPSNPRWRFLVAIPAHDEESRISAAVRSCLNQEYPRERLEVLVIADNCTDRTEAIARGEGATVLRRDDPARRGKGPAIEYLVRRLEKSGRLDDFDALVIIDADSTAHRELLSGFASVLESGRDFVQCLYAVSNPRDSWRTRLMAYAFSLYNGVIPLGREELGMGASFRGNGMCLSVRGLRRVPWRCRGLAEDLEYTWTVRLAGEKIAFLPDLDVRGVMPTRGGPAAASQRLRWEFGRSEVRREFLGPLLRSERLGLLEKLSYVLELTMPATTTLLLLYVVLLVGNVLAVASPGTAGFAAIDGFLILSSGLATLAILAHALSPLMVFGLPWTSLLPCVFLPYYMTWKFLLAFRGKPSVWVRTPREHPAPGPSGPCASHPRSCTGRG
jgi:cellulose synthase/poly-beta-1,6-N-acetylglucosamine synthase-like glycosyltransferase